MSAGLVGFSGGFADSGRGNCGALTGAAFAISFVTGIGRAEQTFNNELRKIAFDKVALTIGARFEAEFGGVTCRDVMWKRFGKWYNFWNTDIADEFAMERTQRGCEIPTVCTVATAAGWGAEFILDLLQNSRPPDAKGTA